MFAVALKEAFIYKYTYLCACMHMLKNTGRNLLLTKSKTETVVCGFVKRLEYLFRTKSHNITYVCLPRFT